MKIKEKTVEKKTKKLEGVLSIKWNTLIVSGQWQLHYKYIDSWEIVNETTSPSVDNFYSNFNVENISKSDHKHTSKSSNIFSMKICAIVVIYMSKATLWFWVMCFEI